MTEIFTIALSLKDVELGLTSPMVGYAQCYSSVMKTTTRHTIHVGALENYIKK